REFLRKRRYRALLQLKGPGRFNAFRIELAPILPMASRGRKNLVIQGHKEGRFPVSLRIVLGWRHQLEWGGASEPGYCPRQTRGAAAMHSEDQNGHPGRALRRFGARTAEFCPRSHRLSVQIHG